MTVVPLRWQGSARIERVRLSFADRSREWLSEWSATRQECCIFTLDQSSTPTMKGVWVRVRSTEGELYLRYDPDMCTVLGHRLAGLPEHGCDAIGEGIGRRALVDLATRLGSEGEVEVIPADASFSASVLDPRRGIAAYRWVLGTVEVDLYVDASFCDAIDPPVSATRAQLVARDQAVLPGVITLEAVLDLGSAALADTVSLRPGEIIKTKVPIDALVEVRSVSGKAAFVGTLVGAGENRALRCSATTQVQGGAK